MANNTKDLILECICDLTDHFDFTQVSAFTASAISSQLHISRSLASQYLNELVKEKVVMKINSRPVYFLHRKKMEEIYKTEFQVEDFYDLEEVKQYVFAHSKQVSDYSKLIGADKSLTSIIKQFSESFEYPISGIPLVLIGEKGTGRRTISQVIFENAARKGTIVESTKLFKIEFSKSNSHELLVKVFGQDTHDGIIDKYDDIVLMICEAQYMSEQFQEKLCQLMDFDRNLSMKGKYKNKHIRYMILSDCHPQFYMNERLIKNIPIILQVPSLQDKSKEEMEELVIHFIQNEGKRMNRKIKISSSVLRALVSGDYEHNMIGLQSIIRIMCASALKDYKGNDEVIVHTYDLPEQLLSTMPIVTDENIIYIDTTTYKRSEEIGYVLDYFDRIIKSLLKDDDLPVALKESKHHLDLLNDYLSFKQRIPPERIKGTEISISNILDVILKKRFINLPSGFCGMLAKLIYMNELYSSSIDKWQIKQKQVIDLIKVKLKTELMYESMIVEDISRLINANLEMKMIDMISIIMRVYLHYYNLQCAKRKTFGMIVCHGYSTATSIADAANTLLENYVFDAVDMPLDVTVDEIKEMLVERLDRMQHQADIIVMVDMGSLEQLGSSLSTAINCNVGVINNVSTRLALNVGNCILNEDSIQTTLEKVSSKSMAAYTVVERQKNDTIVFTSESGIHMAQRMRELFESSFPLSIPIDLEVCDYNQLLSLGSEQEIIKNTNVLFITGTANPHIDNQIFIALEEIISGNNIDLITNRLSKYLKVKQLDQLLDNLRKNFTLQNVVGYLTILNPKVLLDHVTQAIDILQDCLNRRFGGKTLIGIYIHVCCLIERLVTKSAITEFVDIEHFEQENSEFIRYVHESFQSLSKRYNITIPISEIAYLYEFIEADKQSFEDGELVSKLQ